MPVHALAATFDYDHAFGQTFFPLIMFPDGVDRSKLLHAIFNNAKSPPKLASLTKSAGHFPEADSVYLKTNSSLIQPDKVKRMANLVKEFKLLNDPATAGEGRQLLFRTRAVGAVLLAFKDKQNRPYITVLGNPTVSGWTPSDSEVASAPEWNAVFGGVDRAQYLPEGVERSHLLVGSLRHDSRATIPASRDEMLQDSQTVVVTPDTVWTDVVAETDGFRMLLLPAWCDPPVGLIWPHNIQYMNFVNSLKGSSKAYGGFLHLLGECREVFEAWFAGVASEPGEFTAHLNSVKPLWEVFSSASLVDRAVYVFQREQFLWSTLVDTVFSHRLPSEEADWEPYMCFYLYCIRAAACYPEQLGTTLPISHQLFVPYFFKPTAAWQPNWLEFFPFRDVPASLKSFGDSNLISMDPGDSRKLVRITQGQRSFSYSRYAVACDGGGRPNSDGVVGDQGADAPIQACPAGAPTIGAGSLQGTAPVQACAAGVTDSRLLARGTAHAQCPAGAPTIGAGSLQGTAPIQACAAGVTDSRLLATGTAPVQACAARVTDSRLFANGTAPALSCTAEAPNQVAPSNAGRLLTGTGSFPGTETVQARITGARIPGSLLGTANVQAGSAGAQHSIGLGDAGPFPSLCCLICFWLDNQSYSVGFC